MPPVQDSHSHGEPIMPDSVTPVNRIQSRTRHGPITMAQIVSPETRPAVGSPFVKTIGSFRWRLH
jgi:hypothetical protein